MSILTGGPTPEDGKSAYEIAKEKGFVGTEAQWLASLIGPQGATGARGTDGKDGDSAYQIWLKNGHSGTEAQFLSWLRASGSTAGKAEAWSFGIGTANAENIMSAAGSYVRIGQLVLVTGVIGFTSNNGKIRLPFKSMNRINHFTLAYGGPLEESPGVRANVMANSDILSFVQTPAIPPGFGGFQFGFSFSYLTWPVTVIEGPSVPIV